MKIVSIAVSLAVLVLIALTLVPAATEYRTGLAVAALVAALVLLVTIVAGGKEKTELPVTRVEPPVEPIKSVAAPIAGNQAEAEVISFLATLQQKGRLVDFLMDDITPYTDAQVGAVARMVQEGCKSVLLEEFRIAPVRAENEGTKVTVSAGYSADEYRLVGKISGQPPFSGTLMHRGWKTESVKLPRVLRSDDNRLPIIAPAEVELQ
jgi:predicted membrane-bound mannosyltransferase